MAEESVQLQEEIQAELQEVNDMTEPEMEKSEELGNTVGLADTPVEEKVDEEDDGVLEMGEEDDEEDEDEEEEDEEEAGDGTATE